MAQNVVDHHSNPDVHIVRAVKLLAGSENRRRVFRAMYFGKKPFKTVRELSDSTGLQPKQVLTHGKKLFTGGWVLQDRKNGQTVYGKVTALVPLKDRILALASNPKKAKELSTAKAGTTTIYGGVHMGDRYNVGQAGAVGRNAKAQHMSFQQVWTTLDIDVDKLADELGQLRAAIRSAGDSVEHDVAAGQIAAAEQAARSKDGGKALSLLKGTGKWVFEIANRIGASVAADVITAAMNNVG